MKQIKIIVTVEDDVDLKDLVTDLDLRINKACACHAGGDHCSITERIKFYDISDYAKVSKSA